MLNQLKELGFLYAFEESADCAPLWRLEVRALNQYNEKYMHWFSAVVTVVRMAEGITVC